MSRRATLVEQHPTQIKKALILAYDFPPYVSVGGLRPYSWFKYFYEFGIYPVIVTRQWSNKHGNHLDYIAAGDSPNTIVEESETGTIIRTPYKPNMANKIMLKYGPGKYKYLRKVISAFYEILQWSFLTGPKSGLYFGAKEYLKYNKIDIIIATGEPFILFKYAATLSSKHNIPWIADYRDPWTYKQQHKHFTFFARQNKKREKKYTKNTSVISTVSDFFVQHISFNVKNKLYSIVPNGFDNDILSAVENISQNTDNLSIGFAGTIYQWHPIESFISVVEKFVKANNTKITVNLYGINSKADIKQTISTKFSAIKDMITVYPRIKNSELMSELAKNNVLLLFNDYSIMGTKIYDYLAVKRLILLCYANDAGANILKEKYYNKEEPCICKNSSMQAEILKQTSSGIVVEHAQHLYSILKELHNEFSQNKSITCATNNVEQFSRKRQAEKFAETIKKHITK